jgi:hypothetical protein
VRWRSLCRERAVRERQPEATPHIERRFRARAASVRVEKSKSQQIVVHADPSSR